MGEPLDQELTLQTLFSLASAFVKRIRKVQYMVFLIWSGTLNPFLLCSRVCGKNSDLPVPDIWIKNFLIPSLWGFTGSDVDNMLLCLVQAIRYYVKRTYIISSVLNTLWFHGIMKWGYDSSGEDFTHLTHERAHGIRGVGLFLAFWRNFVCQVISAGFC